MSFLSFPAADSGLNYDTKSSGRLSYVDFRNCLLVANLLVMITLVWVNYESVEANPSHVNINKNTGATELSIASIPTSDKMAVGNGTEIASKGPERKWIHNEVVYGFIHIAKTAGTEINGMLANKYDRVCGNKGYSFDALEASKRWVQYKAKHNFSSIDDQPPDFIQKHTHVWGRMRVSWEIMEERGFDNCDYIAHEKNSAMWNPLFSEYKMELHVPCRDPLSHLMSSCNFQKQLRWVGHEVVFNCSATDLVAEIQKCKVLLDQRINAKMNFTIHQPPNGATMKCFNPLPPQRYVDYMGKFLQPRRTQGQFVHIDTNTKHDKEKECIWKQSKAWRDNLIRLMKKAHFYYKFCGECMGSSNELPLGGSPKSAKPLA